MCKNYFEITDNFEKIISTKVKNIYEINQIKNGWTNFVFEVRTNKKIYIFRFPRNSFFSDALIKECEFSKFIYNKTSFITNKLKLCYFEGKPFSIHTKIDGEMLSSVYKNFNKQEKTQLAQDISKFISEIQNIKCNLKLDTTSNFLDKLSFVSDLDYDLNKHKFLKKLEQNNNLTLCHGDLNPGNIIVKNNKMIGVLDFAFVSFSSNLLDLSRIVGRMPSDFKSIIFHEVNVNFKEDDIAKLIQMWDYVEKKYVEYIKLNHKDIILPKDNV